MTARVVRVDMRGYEPADYYDACGHYWAWDETQGLWVHNRDWCDLNDGQPCEPSKR